jgi:hypothetical protein
MFDTNVLIDDVTMQGKATVHLKVSSLALDSDFTARIKTSIILDCQPILV